MKNKLLIALITVSSLFFYSCSKNEPMAQAPKDYYTNDTLDFETQLNEPGLTQEIVDAGDQTPVADPGSFDSLQLADGTNVKRFLQQNDPVFLDSLRIGRVGAGDFTLNKLMARFTSKIYQVCANDLYNHFNEEPPLNGKSRPEQFGYAYVWGSSEINERYLPSADGPANKCTKSGCDDRLLYGLDCSGMVNYCFRQAGLTSLTRVSTSGLVDPMIWQAALDAAGLRTTGVHALSALDVPLSELKSGDIVVWPGKHCGVVLNFGNGKQFFQSNGDPCQASCSNNNSPKRGPHPIEISCAQRLIQILGCKNYTVIRFKDNGCGQVSDIDGNVYETAKIGPQCWFKSNLKTTKFNNGDPIAGGLSDAQWKTTNQPAMDYPYHLPVNTALFGNRYNWYAVSDPRGLCPAGWHVSSNEDWNKLEVFLGAASAETLYLGERGHAQNILTKVVSADLWDANFSLHFLSPVTNETGLTLTPGRFRNASGSLTDNPGRPDGTTSPNPYAERLIYTGMVWTSTSTGQVDAQTNDVIPINIQYYPYNLGDGKQGIQANGLERGRAGIACRCVKD